MGGARDRAEPTDVARRRPRIGERLVRSLEIDSAWKALAPTRKDPMAKVAEGPLPRRPLHPEVESLAIDVIHEALDNTCCQEPSP